MVDQKFKEEVDNVFYPLAKRLGLTNKGSSNFVSNELTIGYFNDEIGFQVSVDLNYFFVFLFVFKPKNNTMQLGYADDKGFRQNVYIDDVLKELGIGCSNENKKLKELGGDHKNFLLMSDILTKMLEDNWDKIVANKNTIFAKKSAY